MTARWLLHHKFAFNFNLQIHILLATFLDKTKRNNIFFNIDKNFDLILALFVTDFAFKNYVASTAAAAAVTESARVRKGKKRLSTHHQNRIDLEK